MKGYLKSLVGFLILLSTPVFSGEVTDVEWHNPGVIVVTYYHDADSEVNCLVFNKQGKPIGSNSAVPEGGGVARVRIQVPKHYYPDEELNVTCK